MDEFTELIKITPSRKSPSKGDIFVVQPKKGIYIFGKVIEVKISSKDPFVNGWNLIYIFKKFNKEIELPDFLDSKEFLIPPMIVNNQGWIKGYFLTIGNADVTTEERKIDLGFWDDITKEYVDIKGNPLSRTPEVCSFYGLGSYGAVGRSVQKVLKANPELLES